MALFSIWLDTQITENGQCIAKDSYGFCVDVDDVDVDSNGDPCCVRASLWLSSEGHAKNEYIRKNPCTSYFCKRLSHIIPTGCTVKTELMSDMALQLLLFHLRLLKRTVAGVRGAAPGADLQTSGCKEAAKMIPFEVSWQIVQPR